MNRTPLLTIRDLSKNFPLKRRITDIISGKKPSVLKAVRDVSLDLYSGESLGLVGESGCGKSTLGKTLIRLYQPDGGQVVIDGRDITDMSRKELRQEAKSIQMIFQDPYSSLNPRMTVGEILKEVLLYHHICTKESVNDKVRELVNLVGLSEYHIHRTPSEFSGGQRQRIGIARALALNPKIIVADEPVSALDVSIQAQIINLLIDLRNQFGLSMLFISHDLRVVRYITNRVAVMYLGKIVELAPTDELFENPAHPYTDILLKAAPSIEKPVQAIEKLIEGDLPSPVNPPSGCLFHPRCPYAKEVCSTEEPLLRNITRSRTVACHFPLFKKAP